MYPTETAIIFRTWHIKHKNYINLHRNNITNISPHLMLDRTRVCGLDSQKIQGVSEIRDITAGMISLYRENKKVITNTCLEMDRLRASLSYDYDT
jgi:ribosomal protein S7